MKARGKAEEGSKYVAEGQVCQDGRPLVQPVEPFDLL